MKRWVIFSVVALIQLSMAAKADCNKCATDDKVPQKQWADKRQFNNSGKENRPPFSPEEYMKKEDEVITKRAKLSASEASAVCPLLHKMKDEQRKIDHQIQHLLDQGKNDDLSESSSKTILKKIKELNVQKIEIQSEYQHKMLTSISAQKLLQLLQADISFDRFMLKKMFVNKNRQEEQHKNKKE